MDPSLRIAPDAAPARSAAARATRLAAAVALLALVALPARAADHLLLSEFAVRGTDAEFVELYNPTADLVDLAGYYLSDYVLASDPTSNYWRMVDGGLRPDPAFPNDFLAGFPPGATIAPGQTIVVSLHDDALFSAQWSGAGRVVRPDYELVQDGTADGVPDLVDPGPALYGVDFILSAAGFSNDRECIVLFYWDGVSDLVRDVDIVQWSNAGPNFNTLSPNKTGVRVDGPDAGTDSTAYLPDTSPQGQDLASVQSGAHDFGRTVSRRDFEEGTETAVGGNGIAGHDETSENLSDTWIANTLPSIGSPGEFGPPALLAAAARGATAVELEFSRAMDAVTAGTPANYSIVRVETAGGQLELAPLGVESAALAIGGLTVRLETGPQEAGALYEVRVSGLVSDDLTAPIVPRSRAFFRGFRPGPELRLDLPRRPFVPSLDGTIEITWVAPQGEEVLLRLFDPEGRERSVLVEGTSPPGGLGVFVWDGRDDLRQRLPAGLYLLHLETPATGDETVAPVVVGVSNEETLR